MPTHMPCHFGIALALAAGTSSALAQASATLNLQINWTDREGNVHGAAWLNADSYSQNSQHQNRYASQTGGVTFTATSPFGDSVRFNGSIYALLGAGTETWGIARDFTGAPHSYIWNNGSSEEVPNGQTLNITRTMHNGFNTGRAVGMMEYLGFMRNYYALTLNANVPEFILQYGGSTAYDGRAAQSGNTIRVGTDMWCAVDVLMHEFGHHVAVSNGLDASNGGVHTYGSDNIRGTNRPAGSGTPAGTAMGAVDGSRLAWSEGLATYLGLGANVFGNMREAVGFNGTAISQYDTDTFYDDISTFNNSSIGLNDLNFGVNIESNIERDRNGSVVRERAGSRLGEGDEWSVMATLWDFADGVGENRHYENNPENPNGVRFDFWSIGSDRLRYGADTVWSWILRGNGPGSAQPNPATTFHTAWRNIATTADAAIAANNITGLQTNRRAEALAAMGEVLVENGIAALPVNWGVNEQRATLGFYEQNNSNSDRFRILIFSLDWSNLVLDSGLIEDATPGVLSTSAQYWSTGSDLPLGGYWWVVLNNAADMNSHLADMGGIYSGDWYWSGARAFYIDVPGPGSAGALALLALTAARRRRS